MCGCKYYNTLIISLTPFFLLAQRIDNTAAFRQINSDKYFRYNYDNDYFTATDEYFTQGINLELVHPALKKNPLTHALLRFKNNPVKYGLCIEQNGYTPSSIGSDDILYGDRPFAADIMLKTFSISTDTGQSSRLSAILSTGVIGQAAFGGEEQTAIHRALKNVLPHGWQHQIRNDVAINYDLGYEKALFQYKNVFLLASQANIRLGTLSNKAQVGVSMMLGKFNTPFGDFNVKPRNRFQRYVYNQSLVGVVGYDATLQGGVFNHNSPYTVPSGDVSRVTVQDNFGAVLRF